MSLPEAFKIRLIALMLAALALARASAVAQTFTNNSPISYTGTLNALGNPYPSVLLVNGVGSVQYLTVTLNLLGSTGSVDAAAFLLVSPSGQAVELGVTQAVSPGPVMVWAATFADDAANSLPNTLKTSGAFRPTASTVGQFPAPAPAFPYSTSLSSTYAGTINGTWTLYVLANGTSRNIVNSWSLTFNGVPQLPRTIILAAPYAQRALISNSLRLPFTASLSITSGHALRINNDSTIGNGVIMGATGFPISTNLSLLEPTGVRGDSSLGTGVLGASAGPSRAGVAGINDAPSGVGALGSAKGPSGVGVAGEASSAFGVGVRGRTTSVGGAGVLAQSTDGNTFALIAENTGNGLTFISKGESIFSGDVSLGYASFSAAAGKLILRNKNTDSILLRPDVLTANEFVQITFADPDGGTPTVGLRYADFGSPGRIDVVGGRLRGVLENTSTIRAKHDVTAVGSALSDLLRLRPVEFTWNAEYGGGRDVCLIAEEVAAIFPSVTSARDGRVDSIRYSGVTALLVRGMQEQQEQLESQRRDAAALREQNARLEERLRRLEAALEKVAGTANK